MTSLYDQGLELHSSWCHDRRKCDVKSERETGKDGRNIQIERTLVKGHFDVYTELRSKTKGLSGQIVYNYETYVIEYDIFFLSFNRDGEGLWI